MSMFSARDLANLLPDHVDSSSLRHTETGEKLEEFVQLKPRIDKSKKTLRYRPGQRPDWAGDEEEEVDEEKKKREKLHDHVQRLEIQESVGREGRAGAASRRREKFEPQIIVAARPSTKEEDEESDDERARRRARARAREREQEEEEESEEEQEEAPEEEEEDEEEIAARRARIRARLQQIKEEEEELAREEEEEPTKAEKAEEEEEESEWETDTDASEEDDEELLKPVFVPKAARDTIVDWQKEAEKEAERERKKKEKREAKILETRQLVADTVQREVAAAAIEGTAANAEDKAGMPDDTDGVDPEAEFEGWKLRELRRIKREREEKAAAEKERQEIERRRNMTEEEHLQELKRLEKDKAKEKKKWNFMQKYYHKGAFFMDESSVADEKDVRKRDYAEPTLEDKFNKAALPAVMQVKNFGRSGQTKWKHLVAEDTTNFDTLWAQNEKLLSKNAQKMGGMGSLDLPERKKRKTE